MAGQLIPPPDIAPRVPKLATIEQRIAIWCDLMHLGEEFLLSGLRRKAETETDIKELFRQWYEKQMQEKDRTVIEMANRFNEKVGRDVS